MLRALFFLTKRLILKFLSTCAGCSFGFDRPAGETSFCRLYEEILKNRLRLYILYFVVEIVEIVFNNFAFTCEEYTL